MLRILDECFIRNPVIRGLPERVGAGEAVVVLCESVGLPPFRLLSVLRAGEAVVGQHVGLDELLFGPLDVRHVFV